MYWSRHPSIFLVGFGVALLAARFTKAGGASALDLAEPRNGLASCGLDLAVGSARLDVRRWV